MVWLFVLIKIWKGSKNEKILLGIVILTMLCCLVGCNGANENINGTTKTENTVYFEPKCLNAATLAWLKV